MATTYLAQLQQVICVALGGQLATSFPFIAPISPVTARRQTFLITKNCALYIYSQLYKVVVSVLCGAKVAVGLCWYLVAFFVRRTEAGIVLLEAILQCGIR